jgi:uncharacterized protein YciI
MRVALMAYDKIDHLEVRVSNREAHLQYIKQTGVVEMAGPLLDDSGQMCGSLIILKVGNMAEANTWAAYDPYNQANLFERTTLTEWNKVIG